MKKLIFLLSLMFLTVLSAAAFDFGLTVDNNFRTSYTDSLSLSNDQKESLWIQGSLTEELSFSAEGSYVFYLTEEDGSILFDSHSLQVDELLLEGAWKMGGEKPLLFTATAGRSLVSDFTGRLMMHKLDGLSLGLSTGKVSLHVTGGYSGLLSVNSSTFLMTQSDYDTMATERTLWPQRAPARAVEMVTLSLSEIFLRQSVSLAFLAQQDLRPAGDVTVDHGKAVPFYLGGGLSGPLGGGGSLFWNGWGYGNFGTLAGETLLGFMAGGGLDWYLAEFLSSKISLSGLYASGDADYTEFYEGNSDGYAEAFLPMTAGAPALVFMPQYSNLYFVHLSWAAKPLAGGGAFGENFMVQLSGAPFLRPTTGPISVSGVAENSSDVYLGTEADLSIRMRLFSDLGLSLSGGIFFPGAAFSDTSMQISGKLGLSLGL